MFRSYSITIKVILLAAGAILTSITTIYVVVSGGMWSELQARRRIESEQQLRSLALVFADRVRGARIEFAGPRIVRVIAPTLSNFADRSIVDDSVSYAGVTATIFSYEPAIDKFIRRATTVKKESGEQAISTPLSADSPAQTPVRTAQAYYGPAELFGRHFYTVYQPTVDAAGKVNGILYVGIPMEFYFEAQRRMMMATGIAAGLVALVASAAVGVVAARQLRPLKALSRRIENLAAGELDGFIPCYGRRDEVGAVAHAVETLRLAGLKARALEMEKSFAINTALQRRADLDHSIASFRTTVSDKMTRLTKGAAGLRVRAREMTLVATEAEQAVVLAGTGSRETSLNMRTVADAAIELSASIDEIGGQLEQATYLATTAAGEAEAVDNRIEDLARAGHQIGNIVSVIRQVADQTNWLALNAAIEAARAGTTGQGFAVVAGEVKALAGETAKATEEIRSQIEGVRSFVSFTVDAIRRLTERMQGLNDTTCAIADAVLAQNEATSEISRNVTDAARGSNETADGLTKVASAAARTAEMAEIVTTAAGSVDTVVAELNREIEEFLGRVAC